MLSTIAEIQKGQGLGSGCEWLAGLVFRVCMAGLVFRVCMGFRIFRGSKYHVTRPPSSYRQEAKAMASHSLECRRCHSANILLGRA